METFFLKEKLLGNFYESKFFKESWNFELCFCYMTFQKFLEFRLFGKINRQDNILRKNTIHMKMNTKKERQNMKTRKQSKNIKIYQGKSCSI